MFTCAGAVILCHPEKHQVTQDGATIRRMEPDGSLFELEDKELKGQIQGGENYFGERRDELCPCLQISISSMVAVGNILTSLQISSLHCF